MNDALLLSMILSISQFCTAYQAPGYSSRKCVEEVWLCAHETPQISIVVTNVHRCIHKLIKKERIDPRERL